MEITPQQKNKLMRLAKVMDKGDLGLLEELNTLIERMEHLVFLRTGPKPVAGVDYHIPVDGEDYVLTRADKKEIADSIKVPVVEKVIEKTEVIREVIKEQPIEITKEVAILDEDKVIEKLENDLPQYGEQFRDGLELLQDEDRLDKSAIKGLKEELDQIRSIRGKGGGGTSAIGVAQTFKYIAHTEQPVGAIDGANKTYTVKNNIWWVAGFTLNNAQIAELPNFTYTGKTITFDVALPAVFSGKDWEIKYIGS